MPWTVCIPLMQEPLTVCEVWNWLQEKRFARNVPKAEVAGVPCCWPRMAGMPKMQDAFFGGLLFGQAKSDNVPL